MAQLNTMNGDRVLVVDLYNETVRALSGSMVAYEGQVNFKNAGSGGGEGMRAAIKRKMTGESVSLMECSGQGRVYLTVNAQTVTVVEL